MCPLDYMCKGTTSENINHTIEYDTCDWVRFSSFGYRRTCIFERHKNRRTCFLLRQENMRTCFYIDMRTEEHVFLRQENMRTRGPFPAPLSATRFANILHIFFQLLSGYMNSAPLTCAPRVGKSMGTSGWCMSLDTCESKSCTHSVPFPRRGIAGGVGLLRLYLIFVMIDDLLSCWLSAFKKKWGVGCHYNYSYYSLIYRGCLSLSFYI